MELLPHLITFLFLIRQVNSQTEQFTILLGGLSTDEAYSVIADDQSQTVYVCGKTLSVLGNSSYGGYDAFVYKINVGGEILWVQQFGTSSNDIAISMAASAIYPGVMYVTGSTEGNLVAGASAGQTDIFLGKMNSSGDFIWVYQTGSSAIDSPSRIAVDASDNIYITGYTWGNLHGQSNSGQEDIFVCKYDLNGNRLWTRVVGSTQTDIPYTIKVGSSYFVITGTTYGDLQGFPQLGAGDAFVARYDLNGVHVWTNVFGSSGGDISTDVNLDAFDQVFAVGYSDGNFEGKQNTGSTDIFVQKLSDIGDKSWSALFGTTGTDRSSGTFLDGSIYIVGDTNGKLGASTFGNVDAFIASVGLNGVFQSAIQFGTSANDYGKGVLRALENSTYVVGYTAGSFNETTNQGGTDGFFSDFRYTPRPSPTPSSSPSVSPSISPTSSASISPSSTMPATFSPSTASKTPSEHPILGGGSHNKGSSSAIIIGASAGGGAALACLLIILTILLLKRKKPVPQKDTEASNYTPLPGASPRKVYVPMEVTNQQEARKGIKYSEITIEHEIGRGEYGVVYKGKWRATPVAIKQVIAEKLTDSMKQAFLAELELMKNLRNHPNIVLFYGVCEDPLCVVLKYLPMGNLYSYLHSDKELTQEAINKIVIGIARGMNHLHKESIIHRDLAARNVLLDEDMEPKISDFGMSRWDKSSSENKTNSNVGPLKHMAPESLQQKTYSKATDVWSYGITLIEIYTRCDAYPEMDAFDVGLGIRDGTLVPPVPKSAPPLVSKLMRKMFQRNPDQRPSFEEICETLDGRNE